MRIGCSSRIQPANRGSIFGSGADARLILAFCYEETSADAKFALEPEKPTTRRGLEFSQTRQFPLRQTSLHKYSNHGAPCVAPFLFPHPLFSECSELVSIRCGDPKAAFFCLMSRLKASKGQVTLKDTIVVIDF
jgi:hypothetical protein